MHADDAGLRRMAVFDVVINNADRKGGHILGDSRRPLLRRRPRLTFNVDDKLRTVLWGWAGEPLDADDVEVLRPAGVDRPRRRRRWATRSRAC